MAKTLGPWDHDVLNCPLLESAERAQARCLPLAGSGCLSLQRADFIVYDPWPTDGPADQKDIEAIRAIRQNHPDGRILIAGGWQWLPEGIRRLMLEDGGILLAPFNPPDLAMQVSGLWETHQRF